MYRKKPINPNFQRMGGWHHPFTPIYCFFPVKWARCNRVITPEASWEATDVAAQSGSSLSWCPFASRPTSWRFPELTPPRGRLLSLSCGNRALPGV